MTPHNAMSIVCLLRFCLTVFVINASMIVEGTRLFVPGTNTTVFENCLQGLKYQQVSGEVRKMINGAEWRETYTVMC